MPVAFGLYTVALTFIATVPLALLAYGIADHLRDPSELTGLLEAGAGMVVGLYLLVFHFDALSDTLVRALTQGSFTARLYVLGPIVAGVIMTDYLLRRIIPLVQAGIVYLLEGDETPSTGDPEATRTRRSVLGVSLGLASVGFAGGFSLIDDFLGTPNTGATDISGFRRQTTFEAPYFPTALSFSEDGYGYLTSLEGQIFRFEHPTPDQESLTFSEVAADIQYPQGVEVVGDTLYTVDNGSAAGGKYGVEQGYEVLQESNGKVIAFDIEPDGSLRNRRTILSNLPVVNSDHALHQIETGPDGRLHLSIGHLGGKKYPEMFDGNNYEPPDDAHPNHEYLGTVIAFDQDGSDVEIVASGLRNVYDLTFDQHGNLFGANNDGMSTRSKVWESVLHISDGANFGYPEYGTFDPNPPDMDIKDPLWVLGGVQSTGIETTDKLGTQDGIVVGILDTIVYIPTERGEDGVYVPAYLRSAQTVIEPDGPPIVVEAGPNDSLWVGTIGRDDTITLYEPTS